MEALAVLENPEQNWAMFQDVETAKGNLMAFNIGRIAASARVRLDLSCPATGNIGIWSFSKAMIPMVIRG
jgi:hypothetical protein